MIIEIIRYTRARGVSHDDVKSAAADIHKIWMSQQPGFIAWEIGENKDGEGLDIVRWESAESADQAQAAMKDIPTGHPWLRCYDMSTVSSERITVTDEFKGGV